MKAYNSKTKRPTPLNRLQWLRKAKGTDNTVKVGFDWQFSRHKKEREDYRVIGDFIDLILVLAGLWVWWVILRI